MKGAAVINLQKRLVIFDDGSTTPILNMYDSEGFDTYEPDECVSFVYRADGQWITELVSNFDFPSKH